MKETRNHNAFVFLTTLSVCLGLMLVGSGAGISAQTVNGSSNLRVIVRQSLYGDALEELVRELERLREAGEDIAIDTSLLDDDTLLSLANLHDFVAKYSDSTGTTTKIPSGFPVASTTTDKVASKHSAVFGHIKENRPSINIINLARASLEADSSC